MVKKAQCQLAVFRSGVVFPLDEFLTRLPDVA
jgi:hypothetical protein